jgi:hypothetical protein
MFKDNPNCIANLPFPNPSLDLAFWKLLIYFIKKKFWLKRMKIALPIYASPAQLRVFFYANLNF